MGSELDEFVERVNERTDIYTVVSRYVPLTQKSGRFWGRCPFHNEKTASFCVSPDKGFFYCFGCGTGGNAFKFLSLIEKISYFEAIKLQAQRLGMDLPTKKMSPEEERRRREEKILFQINESAQEFYHECLTKAARGSVGRKYLAARGITVETIETFKLGYAPDDWEELLTRLTRQGFSPQKAEAAGLITKRKTGTSYYDRFRGRVIIPIADVFGRVAGFGGRIINAEDADAPKYLNTPETAIFNKRNLLFGLDKSNRAISEAGAAIVVEGYMDAIALFSAGIKNVVATLGTAFTREHAKLILRYAKKIIFCYDSDEAGQRATLRALPIVQEAGADVFIIKVPDAKDPDEFIRKQGKAAFEGLIKNAATLVDYHLQSVLARADLTTIRGKTKALQEILPVVMRLEDEAARNEYRQKFATSFLLDEDSVAEEWRKFLVQAERREQPAQAIHQPRRLSNRERLILEASENLLRMMWQNSDYLDVVKHTISQENFSKQHQEIIGWLEKCAEQERRPDELHAAEELSEEANIALSRILVGGDDTADDKKFDLFKDSLELFQRIDLMKQYRALGAQADKYNDSGQVEDYTRTVREWLKVKRKIDNLKESKNCF